MPAFVPQGTFFPYLSAVMGTTPYRQITNGIIAKLRIRPGPLPRGYRLFSVHAESHKLWFTYSVAAARWRCLRHLQSLSVLSRYFYRELVRSSTILLSALESKKQEPERTFPVCHVQALDNLSNPVLDLATGLFSPVSV